MVTIFYTQVQKRLSTDQFHIYLQLLPADLQSRARRYLRWEDAHAFLFGKLLLIKGLEYFGLNGKVLIHQLQYTAHERPYLSEKIDFNISHSEGLVACAISDECRVGLDVERVRSIQLSGFRWQMTAEEWTAVINAQDSQTAFLQYWTKKEAAIKAHGRGMSLELKEIVIEADHLMMEGQVWALYRVELVSGYVSHLVTNKEVNGLKVSRMML